MTEKEDLILEVDLSVEVEEEEEVVTTATKKDILLKIAPINQDINAINVKKKDTLLKIVLEIDLIDLVLLLLVDQADHLEVVLTLLKAVVVLPKALKVLKAAADLDPDPDLEKKE